MNSNALAEERERELVDPSVARLDDKCDPVPLLRVAPQKPVAISFLDPLITGDDKGPEDNVFR